MKKFFLCAVAVAATMSLTSCLSEEEVNLEKGSKGYISVNVSADNELATRATQQVAAVGEWFAVVNNGTSNVYGTDAEKKAIGETLASTPFAPGTYSVKVSNYANLAAAYTANNNFGDAYYEGEATGQTVETAKTKEVSVACGKAKNAKFVLDYTAFAGTLNNVAVTATSHNVTFAKNASTLANAAYFNAAEELNFTINYEINGNTGKTYAGTFTMGNAATLNTLKIKSNTNGTISIISITYDDDFTTPGTTTEVEIDAATGAVVTPAP